MGDVYYFPLSPLSPEESKLKEEEGGSWVRAVNMLSKDGHMEGVECNAPLFLS